MSRPVSAPLIKMIKSLKDSKFSMEIVDETTYVNTKTPILVKCKVCHNTQMSRPDNLLACIKNNTTGCHVCCEVDRRKSRVLPIEDIINKILEVHGNKYTYPNIDTEYVNSGSMITVRCSHHGEFTVSVNSHMNLKTGCRQCGINSRRHTLEKVISDFRKIHKGYYNYSKVIYDESMNVHSKVTIICPVHGDFEQSVHSHKKGQGCLSCSSSNGGVSFKALTWLEYIASTEGITIQHAANVGEYKIPKTNYRVDGYCVETNTVYEFHGDLFHGNIKRFSPDIKNNPFRTETVGELYKLTKAREDEILSLGYKLVTIWEQDFDKLDIPLQRFDVTTFKRRKTLDDLPKLMLELIDDEFVSTEHKHNWKCLICNTKFKRNLNKARIAFRETGRIGCSIQCSNKFKGKSKTASEDRLFELWDDANDKGFNLYRKDGNTYKGMNGKLDVECRGCGGSLQLRPVSIERTILNRKSGCRTCLGNSW